MMRLLCFLALFLPSLSFAGDLSPAESKLMLTEALRKWEARDDKESLEEAVSKFELALSGDEKNLEIMTYLVRGFFLLGDFYIEDPDLKKIYLTRAKDYGMKGLMTNEDFQKREKKEGIEKAIRELDPRETEILYWTAASLGKWSKANGVFSSLKFKGQIIEMIKKVEEQNPTFYHGAVPRFWGSFYAVAPSIAGGDMKKSKKYFEEAIALAPESLTSRVLFAELYWVKDDNKKEFKKELELVLKSSDGPADIAPENRMEKRKAERLLNKMDDLF
jgi:tetratricopeptide (TPR) repeat protein